MQFQNAKILTVAAATLALTVGGLTSALADTIHVAEREDWHRDQRDAA